MTWTNAQIKAHEEAAKRLDLVMVKTFEFISKNSQNITELQIHEFILDQFKLEGLRTDIDGPIVAFGANTSFMHYWPTQKTSLRLQPNMPILIDIWARLNQKGSPFADITWMGYFGKVVSDDYAKVFQTVKLARNNAILHIEEELNNNKFPVGKEIDQAVRETFRKFDWEINFIHGTGHSLGFVSAHGRAGGHLKKGNRSRLKSNIGCTIEPGLYFEEKYGARLELDFYINEKLKMIITTKPQNDLILIKE